MYKDPRGALVPDGSPSSQSSERPERARSPFGLTKGQFWCGIAILIVYLTLSIGSVFTAAPQTDEAVLANPGYNLVHHHNMGTTLYQLGDYMPSSLAQHTYWLPPLHFVTTAVWFQIWGFGMPQLRLLSVLFGMLAIISWFLVVYHLQKVGWMALLAAGLVSTDYFFLIGASHGRMDIMCASLGAAALASYAAFRERSLKKAVLCSHTLAALALVTHPAGIVYPAGLLVMVLWLDARRVSLRLAMLAVVPYIVVEAAWGIYIMQDYSAFLAQFGRNLELNVNSFSDPRLSSNRFLRYLEQEVVFRYAAPFGLLPGTSLINHAKAIVFVAYSISVAGLLALRRLRSDRPASVLALLFLTSFFLLAEISPSKFSYYLPHTTTVLAACLGVFLYKVDAPRFVKLAAILAVGGLGISGTVYNMKRDAYHRSFKPTVASILSNSPSESLVMGSGELWFGLAERRTVLHDTLLGAHSGLRPAVFVMDPVYQMLHERDKQAAPEVYVHVEQLLQHSRLVHQDGYYRVYVPQPGPPAVRN